MRKKHGRPRKVQTEDLIKIIKNYHSLHPEQILKPSKLADFTKSQSLNYSEIGISEEIKKINILYLDFTRNPEVMKFISIMNNEIKWKLLKKHNVTKFDFLDEDDLNQEMNTILNNDCIDSNTKKIILYLNEERTIAKERLLELEEKLTQEISKNNNLTKHALKK